MLAGLPIGNVLSPLSYDHNKKNWKEIYSVQIVSQKATNEISYSTGAIPCIALIGERGVMKTKIFGLAIVLSLATMLGACEGGTEPSGDATTTPTATTTPAEPTDSGTATPATTTEPTATPTTTP
ncbi:hypothetical protein [Cylindrospermopsis raciborskii]|nr:hypothetical protein [Cylindrospermopsis raciborskii]EFA68396.1 conserved hypothetical protein [Cylindrospermopsis raciborskii CS-505]